MINFKFIVLFFFYFHALLFFLYNFPEKIFIEAECVIYLYGVYKINSTQLTSSTTQVTMWIRPRKSFRVTSRYLQKERKSERERERVRLPVIWTNDESASCFIGRSSHDPANSTPSRIRHGLLAADQRPEPSSPQGFILKPIDLNLVIFFFGLIACPSATPSSLISAMHTHHPYLFPFFFFRCLKI